MPPAIVVSWDIRPLRRAVLFGSALVMVGAVAVTGSRWPADGVAHQSIRWIGIALMIACIGGRSWSRLYLGWHKTRRVVRVGPYSVCRNPLYDFSILGTIGTAAQTGSITIALLTGSILWLVLYLVTLREEEALAKIHGEEYRKYMLTVPRFLPRLSLWRDVEMVEARPLDAAKTFFESCLILLAIPVFALIQYLQSNGLLPILFRVY
jgi:protein-S-isoprenylcysteine O-methyltransferase Ste14